MLNNRLTERNQWGDILYIGQYKQGQYRNWGDYPEKMTDEAKDEVLTKLYFVEEAIEDFEERMKTLYGKRDSN
ncbi:MAG: hypothetical protein IJV31_12870 [Clostridia bacterium]|nr:hypothetical protein [Clostridia bacterium]MBQ9659619.1 hypothetical protein [Clostridia bacterium]